MILEVKKLHLIEELLKIQSHKVIAEVEEVIKNASASNVTATKLSDRFAGKLSSKTAKKLQEHIAQSRSEWERDI